METAEILSIGCLINLVLLFIYHITTIKNLNVLVSIIKIRVNWQISIISGILMIPAHILDCIKHNEEILLVNLISIPILTIIYFIIATFFYSFIGDWYYNYKLEKNEKK